MWKKVNGSLVQTVDENRVYFVTNISKAVIESLTKIAQEHNTYPNYLLESGLEVLLNEGSMTYNKKTRPKDRVPHNTSYDKDLLEKVKLFAKEQGYFINDVIEHSVQFIDYDNVKDANYRYRVEGESNTGSNAAVALREPLLSDD